MKIKSILLNICFIATMSCTQIGNKHVIYYTYGRDTLSRIENDDHTYFYKGFYKPDSKNLPSSYIFSKHDKSNDMMSAYILFENNKIQLVRIGDFFEKSGNDSGINIVDFKNYDFINWQDSILPKFKNKIKIDLNISLEKEFNFRHGSLVSANY